MQIESTAFGSIVIDNEKYYHDVIIKPNGEIKKRSKKHSRRIHGHRELAKQELEKLFTYQPQVLILGMGQSASLPMSEESESYLKRQASTIGIHVIRGATPDIINLANEQFASDKIVIALVHVTC